MRVSRVAGEAVFRAMAVFSQMVAFGLVWIGLVLVTADGYRRARRARHLAAVTSNQIDYSKGD